MPKEQENHPKIHHSTRLGDLRCGTKDFRCGTKDFRCGTKNFRCGDKVGEKLPRISPICTPLMCVWGGGEGGGEMGFKMDGRARMPETCS